MHTVEDAGQRPSESLPMVCSRPEFLVAKLSLTVSLNFYIYESRTFDQRVYRSFTHTGTIVKSVILPETDASPHYEGGELVSR